MNITSNSDNTSLIDVDEIDLVNTILLTTTTTTSTTILFKRLFNSTRIFPFIRASTSFTTQHVSSLKNFFIFQTVFNRNLRIIELAILSLTLPLYAIVFILFIELTIVRISKNSAISGGGSRSRSQRRRQRMRSLIWTSNYLLVDFLNLLYEIVYVIIHLSGVLPIDSSTGRFYCQIQVYLPLYLTVLMAYSLTAISIYRRRHFVNLNSQLVRSNIRSLFMIAALWIMPLITAVIPSYLLVYSNILKISHSKSTNQCQISYGYDSNVEALYIFYRLGTIFLLPISISLACYVAIYVDLIRMQRRFTKAFKRHIHIRKNLISQILFLFLNFAFFWLPIEIIMLYREDHHAKDAAQVIKSLNILLDPLIIIAFDTRFSAAARQLISAWPFDQFTGYFSIHRPTTTSSIGLQTTIRKRSKRSTQIPKINQPMTTFSTWNMGNNDDITVLESVSNHSLSNQRPRMSSSKKRQHSSSSQKRMRTIENHV